MSFQLGNRAAVYVNGWNLSSYLKGWKRNTEVGVEDVTTFGATAKTFIPGMGSEKWSLDGLWDGTPNAVDAIVQALAGVDQTVFTVLPIGDALGNAGFAIQGIETKYEINNPADKVTSLTAEAQSEVGSDAVKALLPLAAQTVTGNGSSLDNTASSANGGVGYLHVGVLTGITNVAVKIQHSTNNSTWVDLATFTAVTGSQKGQRVAVAAGATVNRYLRAVYTLTGAGNVPLWVGFGRD